MTATHPNPPASPTAAIDCGPRGFFTALGAGALLSAAVLAPGAWAIYSDLEAQAAAAQAAAARYAAHDRLVASSAAPKLQVETAAHGRDLFVTNCAACHGAEGKGLQGLGKDLTRSWFVAALDDTLLKSFIAAGRPVTHPDNLTKVAMPPKGGHDELTDTDLADIVTFVRGLQDPRRLPDLPEMKVVTAPVTEQDKAAALAAAGGDAELAEYIAHGSKIYAATCVACHGKDARGVPGQGKDLVASAFTKGLDDDQLLAFLKRGRDPGDPQNTTKVAMPPKGGNPALSDDDLLDVIAYVRSLQQQQQSSAAK